MQLIKNIKRLFIGLVLVILLSFCLVACNNYEDLSGKQPYVESIGKKFILQQDYYIYTFRESPHLYLGEAIGLPKDINEKYIGTKYIDGSIIGIAKKGQIIQVNKFSKEIAVMAGSFYFLYVSLANNPKFNKLDAIGLMNTMKNPPFTTTWSDPPIFKTEYALPVPSDGVWWK